MDNAIARIVLVDDPDSSWRGYWDGYEGHAIPAGVNGAYVRGWRVGRVDAGRDEPDEDQLVELAFWIFDRYARKA